MTQRQTLLSISLLAALAAVGAHAGESSAQSSGGDSSFFASPPCPVKQFPALDAVVPIPAIFQPDFDDIVPVFCQIQVTRGGDPVRKAKGRYTADLIVIDNNTGMAESFFVDSGRFKTNSTGRDNFNIEVPANIFADGFESGDVSVWTATRAEFSNNKKADQASTTCQTSVTKSNDP